MTKKVTPLFFVLALLVAPPVVANSTTIPTQPPTSSAHSIDWLTVLLGFGSDTGDGPSVFFKQVLGFGSDTGEGPSTFFLADGKSSGYTATDDLWEILDAMTNNTPWQLQVLGYGGSTGEGPSTFFKMILGYGGTTGEGPNTF